MHTILCSLNSLNAASKEKQIMRKCCLKQSYVSGGISLDIKFFIYIKIYIPQYFIHLRIFLYKTEKRKNQRTQSPSIHHILLAFPNPIL